MEVMEVMEVALYVCLSVCHDVDRCLGDQSAASVLMFICDGTWLRHP